MSSQEIRLKIHSAIHRAVAEGRDPTTDNRVLKAIREMEDHTKAMMEVTYART